MFPSASKIHVEKLKMVYLYILYYCQLHLFCPQNELANETPRFKISNFKITRIYSSEGSVNSIAVMVIKYKYLPINEKEICFFFFLGRGQNGYTTREKDQ